jgi:ketosteroid isomerase-like protein
MTEPTPNDELNARVLMQAYAAGQSPRVPQGTTEDHMHDAMQRYIDALHGSDLEALLDLYAENATLVDPVGGSPLSGKENIRPFITSLIGGLGNAKLSAPICTCIGNKGAMSFTLEVKTGDVEVEIRVIDVIQFDAEGKILLLEAHWGMEDLQAIEGGDLDGFIDKFTPGRGGAALEANMRKTLQGYLDGFNGRAPSTIADLFAEHGSVEDPVGTAPMRGREAISTFFEHGIAMGPKLTLQTPIRASFGRSAAMAFTLEIDMGDRTLVLDAIDVFKFDEAGKVISMQAFWGKKNVKFV